jgi:hypothetical protein
MNDIRPIETHYAGCRFRSRLEARWAVYFDALGIRWEYEPEGYELPDGTCYLPDFWLPQVGLFAEVKPRTFTPAEVAKAAALPCPCVMLDGPPDARVYWSAGLNEYGYRDDYCLEEGHRYWEHEGRFYMGSGADFDDPASWGPDYVGDMWDTAAITAARSARFEHGECG